MSHGPGRLQRTILELMQQSARRQSSPQRPYWRVDSLVSSAIPHAKTSRQKADARKRITRACDRLVALGLLVRVKGVLAKAGVGLWSLPPETPAEAKIRRKRRHTTEEQDRRYWEWADAVARASNDHIARAKRIKKLARILGMLGSSGDTEVMAAAKQADRARAELGCNWEDLLK